MLQHLIDLEQLELQVVRESVPVTLGVPDLVFQVLQHVDAVAHLPGFVA